MNYFPVGLGSLIPVLLSAITISIVILLSLYLKLYKRSLSLMVLAINIAHVFFYYTKLSVLVFQPSSDFHCRILSITVNFGLESAAFWGAMFAHGFYITLKHQSTNQLPYMMKYYLLFAVLAPLINGFSCFFAHFLIYSETERTCVHHIYSDRIDVPFLIFANIPVGTACLASIILYKMSINQIAMLQETKAGAELYVLMIYPGILIFCWGPTLVLQTLMQFGVVPHPTLVNTFVLLSNLQGFFDAVVYGKNIRDALRGKGDNLAEPQTIIEQSHRSITAGDYSLLSVRNEIALTETF